MFPPFPFSYTILIGFLVIFTTGASSFGGFFERGIISVFIFFIYVVIDFLFLTKKTIADTKKEKEEYSKMVREEQDISNESN